MKYVINGRKRAELIELQVGGDSVHGRLNVPIEGTNHSFLRSLVRKLSRRR